MKSISKNKGGRPEKVIKKNIILSLKCSIFEATEIRQKAKQLQTTVSSMLRDLALKHKVNIKTLPQEVLIYQSRMNQICSLLNQLARKKNKNEPLNAIERAEISDIVEELHALVNSIRNYINDIQN